MRNWYEALGLPEDVTDAELEHQLDMARKAHHFDLRGRDSQQLKDWHAAQLDTYLKGVAFLLNPRTRELLDDHLRKQRSAAQDAERLAAEAARAVAEAEEAIRRNAEEAKRRGNADDLRRGFGPGPRTVPGTGSSTTPRPRVRTPPPFHRRPPPRTPPGPPPPTPTSSTAAASRPPPTGSYGQPPPLLDRAGMLVLLFLVIVFLGFGVWALASRSDLPERANQRIASLSFQCIEPALCEEAPSGYRVPLFIEGMDSHLVAYLAQHDYSDEWIGNGTYFTDSSGDLVHDQESISSYNDDGLDSETAGYISPAGDSGLMPKTGGLGLYVGRSPGITLRVTWVLRNNADEIVKVLRFEAPVVECSTACQDAEGESPVVAAASAVYPASEYAPPPLFVNRR